jgi:hypothetical protein
MAAFGLLIQFKTIKFQLIFFHVMGKGMIAT